MSYCKWTNEFQCIEPVGHEGAHKTWSSEKIATLEAELAESQEHLKEASRNRSIYASELATLRNQVAKACQESGTALTDLQPEALTIVMEVCRAHPRLVAELAEARKAVRAFVAWDRAESEPLEKFGCQDRVALYSWTKHLSEVVMDGKTESFEPPRHGLNVLTGGFVETSEEECKRLVDAAMEGEAGDG